MNVVRWVVAVLLAVAMAAGVACGVPEDDGARPIASDDVPFDLLDRRPPETSTTVPPRSSSVNVFLVRNERLAAVERELPTTGGVRAALAALGRGATDEEAAQGLRSAVAAETVSGVELEGSVAVVDLAASFANLDTTEQLLAIAQVVYTATEQPDITAVRFRLDGRPVEVPTDAASLASRPVTRDDYRSVAPAA